MKILKTTCYFILIFFTSCKKSDVLHKIKYEKLNVSFGLTNYEDVEYNPYDDKLISSKIAMSDKTLLIFDDSEFDTLQKNKIKIWIKGKKTEVKENYDLLKQNYHLKEITINDFVNQKNDSTNTNLILPINMVNKSFRKLKNNLLLIFPKENLNYNPTFFIIVYNISTKEKIIINFRNKVYSTSLFLHDITGDGIEEVFVGNNIVNGRNNNYSIIIDNVFSFVK